MSVTRYKNSKSFWKNILRITDFLLLILIAAEVFIIYQNIEFDKNKDLYKVYVKRNYKNFEFLDKRDELFIAATHYVDCKSAKVNTAKRVDILYERMFFIEVAFYLDVAIGEQTQNGCVEQVMVRKVP